MARSANRDCVCVSTSYNVSHPSGGETVASPAGLAKRDPGKEKHCGKLISVSVTLLTVSKATFPVSVDAAGDNPLSAEGISDGG